MTDDGKFEHFILTRYMARFAHDARSTEWLVNMDDERFDRRFDIFARNCLPSVAGQTNQNFRWLIWFDPLVASKYVERVRHAIRGHSNFEVIVSGCDGDDRRRVIEERARPSGWLLTTRLDNDDALADSFVQRLHRSIEQPVRECLNFPNGLISFNQKVFLYRHPSNAFASIMEPRTNEYITSNGIPHTMIGTIMPIRQLDPEPAFIQIVHGENVSNRPRGVRIHKLLAQSGFAAIPHLFSGAEMERDVDVLLDATVSAAVWTLRDRSIEALKRLAPTLSRKPRS